MREVKILHLYSQTLDLYGDYKNLEALTQRIAETGNRFSVTAVELGESISFDGYDMVYIGHGKARNLAACAKHFIGYGEAAKAAIENGQVWLVTGNAREMFGQSFTTVGENDPIPGIGLFDYTAVEHNAVFVSDLLAHPIYDEDAVIYGFANRTASLVGENRYPLFQVVNGFSDGDTPDGVEGTLYKNFFATWSMGPVLARNPSMMKEILHRLLDDDYRECDYSLEEAALKLVAAEFESKK